LLLGIRRNRARVTLLCAMLCLLGLGLMSGCAENNFGTQLGPSTQSVIVTVSGPGANPLTQSVTLTVNIQ
jgi:hypothetical protein